MTTHNALFYSSACSLLVHAWIFSNVAAFPDPWIYYSCVGTSLWNHGFTSTVAQWTDRTMVAVCVGHNLYWLLAYNHPIGLWVGFALSMSGVAFYFASKFVERRIMYHLFSHVCATGSSVVLGMVVAATGNDF